MGYAVWQSYYSPNARGGVVLLFYLGKEERYKIGTLCYRLAATLIFTISMVAFSIIAEPASFSALGDLNGGAFDSYAGANSACR